MVDWVDPATGELRGQTALTCEGPGCERAARGRYCGSSCRARAWRAQRRQSLAADAAELAVDLAARHGRTALAVALTEALSPAELTGLVEALVDASSAQRSA